MSQAQFDAAVADLTDLGVRLDGHPIAGIRYVDGYSCAEATFRHGRGMGVRRTALHAALRERVEEAGVPTTATAVHEVVDRGDHLLVDGEPTRHLVAADGLHSPVRRMLGLDGAPSRHRRYGLRCHVALAPWTPYVEVLVPSRYRTDGIDRALAELAPALEEHTAEGRPCL